MKSIITIIALFLVTLTAKADWVKSGELDSLYLGDAPITFSKYSPDYTKFVTYSAQDSTLRLWDLGTGKVIKERTFDKSYNFDLCEFDFESERFYMVKNGKLYPGSKGFVGNIGEDPNNILWYIDFIGNLQYKIIIQNSSEGQGKYPLVETHIYRCSNLIINQNNIVIIYYNNVYMMQEDPFNGNRSWQYDYFTTVSINKVTNNVVSKNNYEFKFNNFYKYTTSFAISYLAEKNINYYLFSIKDSLLYYKQFETNDYDNNYPSYKKNLLPFEINFNTLVYSDNSSIIKFYSRDADRNLDLSIPHDANSILNLKLIHSERYSIYYLKNKYFVLSDNLERKILDTISLPFGNVCYSVRDSMVYSVKSNTIYRRGLVFEKNEIDYIYINKTSYLNTDTIVLKKNYNQSDSYLIWTIDGKIYTEVSPKVIIPSPGYYNVKLEFLRNGKQYLIERDSFIIVYDPTDIQDFAERKYIFKQDADGIYCHLEGEGEVSLYDNVGRLVRTYQIENERYIRKEDLERGVYFLSIQTNGNVYHEKVLVE